MAYRRGDDGPDYQDPEEDPTKPPPVVPPPPVPDPEVPPVPATTAPAPAAPVPAVAPPAAPVQNMDRAWTDFVQQKYGQASRGAGFANMAAGGLGQAVSDFNQASGGKATLVPGPSGDMVDFGDGRGPVDVVTAQGLLWNQRLGGNNGEPGGQQTIGAGSSGNSGGMNFSSLFGANGGGMNGQGSALFDMLMKRARGSATVDPNDPVIRQQADTYNASQTRSTRQYLQQLAESKGPGGNIGAEGRMMAEKAAQAGAEHEGALMQHDLDARRQEIQQALQQAGQFLTAQQQLSLQEELGQIDAKLKDKGLNLQDSQFTRDLASRDYNYGADRSQKAFQFDEDNEFRRTHGG